MEDPPVSDFAIHHFRHPSWLTNTYLILCPEEKRAFLIDAGAPIEAFRETLEEREFKLEAIFLTHEHQDHVSCLGDWLKYSPAKVFAHKLTLEALAGALEQNPIQELVDGQQHQISNVSIKAIYTPGHTHSHFSFLLNESDLFTGDTLFRGSIGSTIAPGHSTFEDLKASVLRLVNHPAETRVWPGHMNPSTVEQEVKENPFVQAFANEQELDGIDIYIRGRSAFLLLAGKDYDGGEKLWIRYADRDKELAVVPGSWRD